MMESNKDISKQLWHRYFVRYRNTVYAFQNNPLQASVYKKITEIPENATVFYIKSKDVNQHTRGHEPKTEALWV